MNTKKILFFNTTPPRGGSAYLVRSMAKALTKYNWEINIIIGKFQLEGDKSFFTNFNVSNIFVAKKEDKNHPRVLRFETGIKDEECYLLNSKTLWDSECKKWERSILKTHIGRQDIVHISHIGPHIEAISKIWDKSKIVLHIHGPELKLLEEIVDNKDLKFYYERAINCVDIIIVNSKSQLKKLEKLTFNKKIIIYQLLPSIDTKLFYQKKIYKKNGLKILYIGRYLKIKRMDILLNAYASLKSKYIEMYDEITLTIIGGQKGETTGINPLDEIYKQKKININIIPWVKQSELPQYIRQHDVLCMPSDYESFGLVAAEAMSCGVPPIVSDGTGISEFMKENSEYGDLGWIFSSGNTKELIEILANIFVNQQEIVKRRINSHKLASEKLSLTSLANQLVRIYK